MKREKECKGNFKCWMKVLFRVTMDSYNYISFPVVSSSFFRYCTTTLDGSWTMSHDIWNYSTDRLLFKDDTFRDHSQGRSMVEFGVGITQAADRRADSTESSFQYIKNNIRGNCFKNHRTLIRGEKKMSKQNSVATLLDACCYYTVVFVYISIHLCPLPPPCQNYHRQAYLDGGKVWMSTAYRFSSYLGTITLP